MSDSASTVSPSILAAAVERMRLNSQRFYLVVLPEDSEHYVREFASFSDLADELGKLLDKDVAVMVFLGERFHISKPPLRHLLTPHGAFPLYPQAVQACLEADASGFLGRQQTPPTLPAALADDTPTAPQSDAPQPDPTQPSPLQLEAVDETLDS